MIGDYVALRTELTTDPTGLGLVAADDDGAADLLNGASRPLLTPREFVEAHEVYEAIVDSEWSALSPAAKSTIADILAHGRIRITGGRTRATFAAAFPAGSASRANLLALANLSVPRSRAEEIFGVSVTSMDIAAARSHP